MERIFNVLRTHSWVDGQTPHQLKQDGKAIRHHHCEVCSRDFAQGINGTDWAAVYVGIQRLEPLADSVTARWLAEECPGRPLESDHDDRAMRKA